MEMTGNPAITLNGSPHSIASEVPLDRFLDSIGLAGKPVVVELNEQAIFPRDYADTLVSPGDRLEVVTLAAGG